MGLSNLKARVFSRTGGYRTIFSAGVRTLSQSRCSCRPTRGLECFLCFTRGFAAGGFGYAYAHPGRGFINSLRPLGAASSHIQNSTSKIQKFVLPSVSQRSLPPTRLGLRVSGYACACYALTGRSGLWLYFLVFPELTLWATELPSLNGTPNSLRPLGAGNF